MYKVQLEEHDNLSCYLVSFDVFGVGRHEFDDGLITMATENVQVDVGQAGSYDTYTDST